MDGAAGTDSSTSTDGSTVAVPTPHPVPGHLDDPSPVQLAAAGQWTALAALAHHGGTVGRGLQIVRQLAEHAGTADAFRWLWAVLADQLAEAWAELRDLPPGLSTPSHQRGALPLRTTA